MKQKKRIMMLSEEFLCSIIMFSLLITFCNGDRKKMYPSVNFKEEQNHQNNYHNLKPTLAEKETAPTSPPIIIKQDTGNTLLGNWTIWVPIVVAIALLLIFIVFFKLKTAQNKKDKILLRTLALSPTKSPPPKDVEEVKPQDENIVDLVFFVEEEEQFEMDDLLEAAADLQTQSLCSSLYKVSLKNDEVYAVKRLKKLLGSSKEFGDTMTMIGNLKHPNILPLIAHSAANEEKLLIYRYQRKGSLLTLQEDYAGGNRDFPWTLRLSIAVGIARGLNFIYQTPHNNQDIIPHGNIKPSNIMISEEDKPMISDYGYSIFLDPKTFCVLKSNGYTAPERVLSEQSDVFSFGVILLELLTGKTVEKSGFDLPKWVKSMVREEWTGEVFDKKLCNRFDMYAFPLLNISLKCVAHFPENRPTIAEVLEKIEEVVNAVEEAG